MGIHHSPSPVHQHDTLRCGACLEDVPVSSAFAFSGCDHTYCRACVKAYAELRISTGDAFPACFHPIVQGDGRAQLCGKRIADGDLKLLVAESAWRKCVVFRYNQTHKHARQCPYCSHSQLCDGPQDPACACTNCGRSFCFIHGSAHENGKCDEYEEKNADHDALSSTTIHQISKPCPGCSAHVEKNGGCNHMRCALCRASFCWLCLEIVSDVPAPPHYAPSSKSACAGLQNDPFHEQAITILDEQLTPPRREPWWMTLVMRCGYVVTAPPAFIVAGLFKATSFLHGERTELISSFRTIHLWSVVAVAAVCTGVVVLIGGTALLLSKGIMSQLQSGFRSAYCTISRYTASLSHLHRYLF